LIIDNQTQTNFPQISLVNKSIQTKINKNIETQTDFKEILKPNNAINENNLDNFLKKSLNLIEEALFNREEEAFECKKYKIEIKINKKLVYDEEPEYEYNNSLILRTPLMTNDLPKNSEISDFSWNANGTYLAVCYYVNDHIGPCSHQMLINIFQYEDLNKEKNFKNKISFEVNCIKAIEAHPKKSNLFAFCNYLGEIAIINLNNEKDQIQFTSKIDVYFHKELIVGIKWIDFNKDGNYVIN
jgi:hypothetical protein